VSLQTLTTEVMTYYKRHGRRTLPWRRTRNPYRILVSEIMLQQTQVSRVIPKYKSFIKKFPTVQTLRKASLADVLREWQGLGYNRRAKFLHVCAKAVVEEYAGKFPTTHSKLVALPGIGTYTAGAILAFAHDIPHPIIETNIRSVFLHFCFSGRSHVSDKEILPLIEVSLASQKSARVWYQSLMDYGSYLKTTTKNPSQRSLHHVVQKKFKGSDREIRGAILRALTQKSITPERLAKELHFKKNRTMVQIEKLCKEGLAERKGRLLTLPQSH